MKNTRDPDQNEPNKCQVRPLRQCSAKLLLPQFFERLDVSRVIRIQYDLVFFRNPLNAGPEESLLAPLNYCKRVTQTAYNPETTLSLCTLENVSD